MHKQFLRFTFFLLMCLTLPLAATAQVVNIPDANLRAAIEEALGKAAGATITANEMATLTHLDAPNANISDLTGLEHAINLTELFLSREYVQEVGRWVNSSSVSDLSPLVGLTNLTVLWLEDTSISDISPVTGLTNLTRLWLGGNAITDISPVARLTNLTGLSLWSNNITDISPLSGLTNLTRLELGGNDIADISPLAGLTNLTGLELGSNNITDISALTGLTNLTRVDLRHNNISDISSLVANTGLGGGDEVVLNDNSLSIVSIKTHVPALQSRGVIVEFDDTTHLNVGAPRTVRMIYFLPNDRPYRPEMVQRMKDEIRNVQRLFADWMEAHGYGRKTFRIETDDRGDPVVHHLNAKHRESYYKHGVLALDEVHEQFDLRSNLYFIVPDIEVLRGADTGQPIGGSGGRHGKYGGYATAKINFGTKLVAHELGHAFGLEWHDFSNDAYIMSYGNQQNSLSACHAEFLAVNPYFNISTAELSTPRIERLSPLSYPADSKHFSIKLKVNDPEGLHQLLVIVQTIAPHGAVGQSEFKACRSLSGKKEAIIDFEYDGIIPSSEFSSLFFPVVHPISIYVVDIDGNVAHLDFKLVSDQSFAEINKVMVDLPDRNLLTAIKSSLNETWGNQIFGESLTRGDMTRLVYLDGRASNISNLTGLEYATNLRAVDLGAVWTEDIGWVENNSISDLSPLSNLTGLTRLTLRGNNITDLSPLSGLVNLKRLEIEHNSISDLSPLKGLINLTELKLFGNGISDISPLAGLTHLTELSLSQNNVSDISPLSGLINLRTLFLLDNTITNFSPLAGLTNLTRLALRGNNISDLSALAVLTNLETLGLSYNNISDLTPLAGLTNLARLGLRGNRISDISPVAGLTNLKRVDLRYNDTSDISPLVTNTGVGSGDEVLLNDNPLNRASIEIHVPALENRGVTVEYDPVIVESVNIPDTNLHAKIAKALEKAPGAPITTVDMARLTDLTARGANITNLTGLEFATNLTSLDLGYGDGKTSHAVKDLSPLADLTRLTSLHLPGKSISDISAVADLTNLTWLNLWGNPISDISPVAGLTNLTDLYLGGGNNISDISPLVANTGLGSGDTVNVQGNPLSYQSIHTHIPTLQSRGVTVEFDADETRSPDVNGDGNVDVLDLIVVTSYFGNTGENIATDVSGDGVVDVLDLVLVAGMFRDTAAAPSAQHAPETLTAVEVRGWLTEARALENRNSVMQRGILVLQQLLVALTPTETELLANYPNPFNPETWIPYRLAEDAFVTLTIYDGSGHVVRPLNVGHRIASAYESRSKAIHWNGTNGLGEQVASGVYFYHLSAGDFSATRRMLILK